MLEIGKDDMFGPRGFYEEKGGRFVPKPRMARLVEEFFERCRAGGVRTLNESGLTPEAYHDGVKRFIDVQVEGNLAFRKPVVADPPPSPKYAEGDPGRPDERRARRERFQGPLAGLGGRRLHARPSISGGPSAAREISLSTLSDGRSWILHPDRVACSVSPDGAAFREVGSQRPSGRPSERGDHPHVLLDRKT